MGRHSIWASEALEKDRLAPPAEKQAQGWLEEVPPHEWFNWHMHRTDVRLNNLEEPVGYVVLDLPARERTETIFAGQRFNLPRSYVVGADQLHVYLDGLLCHKGPFEQYMECGEINSESDYIRWNDDIDPEFDIRIEIPIRANEPSLNPDDTVAGNVAALIERVNKLEEPVFSTRLDSPANSRDHVVAAGELFTFDATYVVGSNQLQVFKNGILLYENADYEEVGIVGEKSSDIRFLADVEIGASIRAYIANRNAEEYTVLGSVTSLKTIEEKVALFTGEVRVDIEVKSRIEAMSDYIVPQYRVGSNTLKIWKNGMLLVPNRDYTENADDGPISQKIIWNGSVDAGTLLSITAPSRVE